MHRKSKCKGITTTTLDLSYLMTSLTCHCHVLHIVRPCNGSESRTREYGAHVLFSTAGEGENREVAAARMAQEFAASEGCALLHPFDDWDVIHGQGTLALEMFEQMDEQERLVNNGTPGNGALLDTLLVPTGGGGMAAGCCLAGDLHEHAHGNKQTGVWAIELEGFADHCESLRQGERVPLEGPPQVCNQ